MAEPFNRLLVRPSEDHLLAALRQAAAQSPVPPLTRPGEAGCRDLVGRALSKPEGRAQWEAPNAAGLRGSQYVSLAWWTDHQGGLHARVAAGNSAGEG